MNKLDEKCLDHLILFLDYITLFEFKYSNKKIKEKIIKSGLDKKLDLRNIKMKNENTTIYKILKKHKFLESIIIEFRKINDTHLMQIGASEKINENLQEINLNGCHNITDKGLIHLANKCPNLIKLEVYWIPNITDDGLRPILENCKNLKYLNLSGLKHVTVEGSLKLINSNLKNLEHINLTRCVGVTDEFLVDLIENSDNIKELNLYALPFLKCDFLKNLAEKDEKCKIEFLDLCGNQNLDDEIFKSFSNKKALKKLKYLNLSWCSKITDTSIEALAPQLDSLELLSLHGILGITDKSVEYLYSNENIRGKLKTLDLYGCSNILCKDYKYLNEKFPKVTCFKYHF